MNEKRFKRNSRQVINTTNIKKLKVNQGEVNSLISKNLNFYRSYEMVKDGQIEELRVGESYIKIEEGLKYNKFTNFVLDNVIKQELKDKIILVNKNKEKMQLDCFRSFDFIGVKNNDIELTSADHQKIKNFLNLVEKYLPKIIIDYLKYLIYIKKKKFDIDEKVLAKIRAIREGKTTVLEFYDLVKNYVTPILEDIDEMANTKINLSFNYIQKNITWQTLLNQLKLKILNYLNSFSDKIEEKKENFSVYTFLLLQKTQIDAEEMKIVMKRKLKRNLNRKSKKNIEIEKETSSVYNSPTLLFDLLLLLNNYIPLELTRNEKKEVNYLSVNGLFLSLQMDRFSLYSDNVTKNKTLIILKRDENNNIELFF